MDSTNLADYFCKLQCCYWHEYFHAYDNISAENKTITIIGGDCGSSALYFLLKGAKYIIQFEREEEKNRLFKETVCKQFNICDKVEINGEWNGSQYPNSDIFIMDCEGCEEKLQIQNLQKYNQFCIAIHDWIKNRDKLIHDLYYTYGKLKLNFVSEDGREIVLCRGV